MLGKILATFGYRIVYTCDWGEYEYRYNGVDASMCRPIHSGMSVAPPWAKRRIIPHTD